MSEPRLSEHEAAGLRFMLHVFYCPDCPTVTDPRQIRWLRSVAPEGVFVLSSEPKLVEVEDYREADRAAISTGHICPEGFVSLRAARARGWLT